MECHEQAAAGRGPARGEARAAAAEAPGTAEDQPAHGREPERRRRQAQLHDGLEIGAVRLVEVEVEAERRLAVGPKRVLERAVAEAGPGRLGDRARDLEEGREAVLAELRVEQLQHPLDQPPTAEQAVDGDEGEKDAQKRHAGGAPAAQPPRHPGEEHQRRDEPGGGAGARVRQEQGDDRDRQDGDGDDHPPRHLAQKPVPGRVAQARGAFARERPDQDRERAEEAEPDEGREAVAVDEGRGHVALMRPFRIPEDQIQAAEGHGEAVEGVEGDDHREVEQGAVRGGAAGERLQRQPEHAAIGEQATEGGQREVGRDRDRAPCRPPQQLRRQAPELAGDARGEPRHELDQDPGEDEARERERPPKTRGRHGERAPRAQPRHPVLDQEHRHDQGRERPGPGPVGAEGQGPEPDQPEQRRPRRHGGRGVRKRRADGLGGAGSQRFTGALPWASPQRLYDPPPLCNRRAIPVPSQALAGGRRSG